ncbi:MAG: uracil-DNA glycosylase [Candidatus Kryptoniota bacterium]
MLNADIISCRKCPRLVEWREKVAREKTARFLDETYWGKPVPGFGDPNARVLIVGLAPAAHGANRTGRMFTGDRSGEWLYGTLHKFKYSNKQLSISADDDLELRDCYITVAVRCAPPANKPLKDELENCRTYLLRELEIFQHLKVIVALGRIAFDWTIDSLEKLGLKKFDKQPKFTHGAKIKITEHMTLIASYHPSQQNTFTGRLTRPMFESIFEIANELTK